MALAPAYQYPNVLEGQAPQKTNPAVAGSMSVRHLLLLAAREAESGEAEAQKREGCGLGCGRPELRHKSDSVGEAEGAVDGDAAAGNAAIGF